MESQITWEKILYLSNGKDANGLPLSAATLAIDELKSEQEVISLKNIVLSNAAIQVSMSGGCAVVTADFPKGNRTEFFAAKTVMDEWMSGLMDSEKDNQMLTLTIVPLLLDGAFYFIMHYLVFTDSYEAEDKLRLIMGWDNNATIPVIDEAADINSMIREADEELNRQINELKESIALAEEEKKKNQYNPYEESVKKRLANPDYSKNKQELEDEMLKSGFRVSKEDDDH
ncbi:hypothetical protein LKD70_09090 [Ruminococcus sp. CLA-AA-H200]|uniref:Uncharacterized protein n=1 Tax=Ruminococcus turbiniformis TaxID=2881258 RepID=A0ABS8FY99_9FIRM|nr:hypothetical protein [Ruminococcus turbiniformis]MCC2254569.1 hypothetical protein [Ruminococcus turbiniformis]